MVSFLYNFRVGVLDMNSPSPTLPRDEPDANRMDWLIATSQTYTSLRDLENITYKTYSNTDGDNGSGRWPEESPCQQLGTSTNFLMRSLRLIARSLTLCHHPNGLPLPNARTHVYPSWLRRCTPYTIEWQRTTTSWTAMTIRYSDGNMVSQVRLCLHSLLRLDNIFYYTEFTVYIKCISIPEGQEWCSKV